MNKYWVFIFSLWVPHLDLCVYELEKTALSFSEFFSTFILCLNGRISGFSIFGVGTKTETKIFSLRKIPDHITGH